jgi:putative ABC transport system permease protein
MFKATIKGLLAHKLRLVLTALAVVLGVGFISGTYVLTDSMNTAFDKLFKNAALGIDVYVRDAGDFEAQFGGSRQPIGESVLETVQEIEGVELAAGSVEGYAQFIDKKGKAITPGGAPTFGVNWTPEPLNPMRLEDGSPPEGTSSVVIDANTASKFDFAVGDRVEIITLEKPREFTVSGIASFGGEESLGGATLALFDTSTAQQLLDKEGKFDSIEVAGEEGLSESELRDRVQTALPEGVEAETAADVSDEQSDAIQEGLGFFSTFLLVFAGIALFVGAFLIFNTFSITVAQRTREFALLRALGASGGQVMTSVVVEALIVGIVAAVVGLGAGVLIAMGLNAMLEAFGIDLPQAALQLHARTVIVSLIVGIVTTVVSAVIPARRAARISPMEALRESAPVFYRSSTRRVILGVLLSIVGVGILFIGLFAEVSQELTYLGVGAAIIFLGAATLAPIFARPIASGAGSILHKVFAMPGRLAQQNATRNPKRTAATAAALMIGLALVGFIGILADSAKTSTNETLDRTMKADILIQSESFASPVISPKLAEELRKKTELEAVAPFRFGQFKHERRNFFVVASDPLALQQTADIGVTSGDLTDLQTGGIFIYAPTAQSLDVDVGDTYVMQFAATGPQREEVVGLFDDKALVGSDYLVSIDTYNENFSDRVDSQVLIKASDAVPYKEARASVEEVTDKYPNVKVENQAEAKETFAGQINQLLGLVTALLALALIIALLGITNTLALSVYERTRELGLLRAVGMSRRQAKSMIRWEAVIIVIVGGVLGTVIGIFLGWAFVQALENEGITTFSLPGGQLVTYVILAVLAGILAAIPPARRAARLNVLKAIATE